MAAQSSAANPIPCRFQRGDSGRSFESVENLDTEYSYELEDRSGCVKSNVLPNSIIFADKKKVLDADQADMVDAADSRGIVNQASSTRLSLVPLLPPSIAEETVPSKFKKQIPARLRRWKRAASNWRAASGWRAGVMLGACTATLVLIINVTVTRWTVTSSPRYQPGIAKLFVGSCSAVRTRGRWLHLAIDLFSRCTGLYHSQSSSL